MRLCDQVLGIVGLGRIGTATARLALGLGMRVIATDPNVGVEQAAERGVDLVSPAELFAVADVVSNHMSGGPGNVGYFNSGVFARFARRPLFINTARGSAVVTADLVAALDAGQLRGAGLDVLADESGLVADDPLLGRDNVLISPHAAFYSEPALADLERIPARNLVAYLTGDPSRVFKRVD